MGILPEDKTHDLKNETVTAFVKFRQNLRQLLYENGVRSNPGWTEDDIVRAFRGLLNNADMYRAELAKALTEK